MKHTFISILSTALILSSQSATGFEKGDLILRAGVANVSPDDSSSNVFVGGADQGFDVSVRNDTQLGFNIAYFLTDKLNIEVLASTPFTHDVDFGANNPLGTGSNLGRVTHLPPTVTLNYYFNNTSSPFQPYIGAGINYTIIFEEEFSTANREIGLSDLSLDNSFGLSAQIGLDYLFDERWFANGSIRWIDIDTEASFNLNGTAGSVGSIEIDPLVYMGSIGYRF